MLAAFIAAVSLGCGYHFIGTHTALPEDVHSLSVGNFVNESREVGLDKTLAFAFERELYQRGSVPFRENPAEGDGVITGTIREFRTRPISFDANDEALQYEAELTCDIVLRRQSDGKVLWRGSRLRSYQQYSVSRQTVVPSSSQFQQGTLDFQNLAELSDIQLAETEKRLTIERMVRALARDVHDRILDDF